MSADIGLIGLAVMGQNLVLNMNDKGFRVSVFNRTLEKVDQFIAHEAKGTSITGFKDLKSFVLSIRRPRAIILMIKAGGAIDDLIHQLIPLLEKGDILIDGGNSHYVDTERRVKDLKAHDLHFLGVGISGGEEGARHGPSIMPGGDEEAYPRVRPIFEAIAAKTDSGEICCEWMGPGGAGHFVKMVHNGIEYADLELIAETYDLASRGLKKDTPFLAGMFERWNKGVLKSFLIEITSRVLCKTEPDGSYLIEHVLDVANQKGTGKWASQCALDLGLPISLITEAVFQRFLSSLTDIRKQAVILFARNEEKGALACTVEDLEAALYAAKILSYVQGFLLLQQASKTFRWRLDLGAIARIWKGGCIIRSAFLDAIKQAYIHDPHLMLLAFDPFFQQELHTSTPSLRTVIRAATSSEIPVACFSAALSFFDSLKSTRLPTNLIQLERDFFGAHTFEKIEAPRETFFHADWSR